MQENQIKGKILFYTEDFMLYQIVTHKTDIKMWVQSCIIKLIVVTSVDVVWRWVNNPFFHLLEMSYLLWKNALIFVSPFTIILQYLMYLALKSTGMPGNPFTMCKD